MTQAAAHLNDAQEIVRRMSDLWRPGDSFDQRLIRLRKELGMTIDDIVTCVDGVSAATWSNWERGLRPQKLREAVEKIAAGTKVDPDWLMYGDQNRKQMKRGARTLVLAGT